MCHCVRGECTPKIKLRLIITRQMAYAMSFPGENQHFAICTFKLVSHNIYIYEICHNPFFQSITWFNVRANVCSILHWTEINGQDGLLSNLLISHANHGLC